MGCISSSNGEWYQFSFELRGSGVMESDKVPFGYIRKANRKSGLKRGTFNVVSVQPALKIAA